MRTIFLTTILIALLAACEQRTPDQIRESNAQREAALQQQAEAQGPPSTDEKTREWGIEKAEGLSFFYHPGSKQCFAYMWGGGLSHGGPALATVPCADVKHLLANPPPE